MGGGCGGRKAMESRIKRRGAITEVIVNTWEVAVQPRTGSATRVHPPVSREPHVTTGYYLTVGSIFVLDRGNFASRLPF